VTACQPIIVADGHAPPSAQCDIAMLTVEDDEFWEGVEALEINGLPPMQESVTVVGFPTGGDNVCVTKGVVSRLDRQQVGCHHSGLLGGGCLCSAAPHARPWLGQYRLHTS
jgi:hypothetical protein